MDSSAHLALIERARSGSHAAFSRLVADNQHAVRAFLRRMTITVDDADDLAQEAFVTAWAKLDRLRDGVAFRTLVCGIAYRKLLNNRKRYSRSLERDTQWHELGSTESQSTVDIRLSVQAALSQLPVDQRAAISLCVAGAYSHAEASEILGLPLGTIKSHIHKGRATLARLLGTAL